MSGEFGYRAFYGGSKRYRGPRGLIPDDMPMPIDWDNETPAFDGSNTQ